MNKVRCQNKNQPHFFDADRYSVCPHCGCQMESKNKDSMAGMESLSNSFGTEEKEKKPKKMSLFGGMRKSKPIEKQEEVSFSEINTGTVPGTGMQSTGTPYSDTVQSVNNYSQIPMQDYNEQDKDCAFPKTDILVRPNRDREEVGLRRAAVQEQNAALHREQINQPVVEPVQPAVERVQPAVERIQPAVEQIQPVREQVQPSVERKKPVRITDLDDVKTVSVYATDDGEEPVTGWLVCIKGVSKGKSFGLKAGVNTIGRDGSSYVCLKKDEQVSRNKHAVIIYEPKKKIFYLQDGEGLVYCNDELISGRQEIKINDTIEIGSGQYMFIPFCGEHFDWNTEE